MRWRPLPGPEEPCLGSTSDPPCVPERDVSGKLSINLSLLLNHSLGGTPRRGRGWSLTRLLCLEKHLDVATPMEAPLVSSLVREMLPRGPLRANQVAVAKESSLRLLSFGISTSQH